MKIAKISVYLIVPVLLLGAAILVYQRPATVTHHQHRQSTQPAAGNALVSVDTQEKDAIQPLDAKVSSQQTTETPAHSQSAEQAQKELQTRLDELKAREQDLEEKQKNLEAREGALTQREKQLAAKALANSALRRARRTSPSPPPPSPPKPSTPQVPSSSATELPASKPAFVTETMETYKETQRAFANPYPGGRQLRDTPDGHCQLVKGDWCGPYWTQQSLPPKPPPRHDTPCPEDCNNAGVCNHATGTCECQIGWKGPSCSIRDERRCYMSGDDGRDQNVTREGWVHSRCQGICDFTIGACFCPPGTKYEHIPDTSGKPGAPPIKQGKPMYWCMPNATKDGAKIPWAWSGHTYDDVFGPNGWCNSETARNPCSCAHDGLRGANCQTVVDKYCPNQCTGNGECMTGFCKCKEGWYGHDCSQRKAGLPFSPDPLPDRYKPVVRAVPAAHDPQVRPFRKRPFIYVYELPAEYNAKMLAYRVEGGICVNRFFNDYNLPEFIHYNAYAIETVFHELMLTSEHRTLDPEEADYFYVPLYVSCLADITGKGEKPYWPKDRVGHGQWGHRPFSMSMMAFDAQQWIKNSLPYWNRTGGKDHIWFFSHDEGPCYQHKDLWDSIILSHWGRLDFPHGSNTSYGADDYSREEYHVSLLPTGWLGLTSKAHPCHDPTKHLVVPVFKQPTHYRRSIYLGGKQRQKDILFFFRGDMGLNRPGCVYSRCIRQSIWHNYTTHGWKEKYNALYGDGAATPGDYSELLSRSKYCLVIPGDGWSARYEDSMTHGCVPVIIMDNTLGPFESLIDYSKFSIRVAERDVARLPEILLAITPQQYQSLQDNVHKAWMRFRWNGLPLVEKTAREAIEGNLNGVPLGDIPGTEWTQTADDDAFSTIMQWLYSRLPEDKKLQAQPASIGSSSAVTQQGVVTDSTATASSASQQAGNAGGNTAQAGSVVVPGQVFVGPADTIDDTDEVAPTVVAPSVVVGTVKDSISAAALQAGGGAAASTTAATRRRRV